MVFMCCNSEQVSLQYHVLYRYGKWNVSLIQLQLYAMQDNTVNMTTAWKAA